MEGENINLASLVSNNAVLGAVAGGTIAFVYKIWKILKSDQKEIELDNLEKTLRDELRDELRLIKTENTHLKIKNDELYSTIVELKSTIKHCKKGDECPNRQV